MKPPHRRPLCLLLALALAQAPVPAAAVELRDVLGVSHAAGKYNFTGEDYLNEGADRILELGSRVIKVFVVADNIPNFYSFNSDWSPRPLDAVELIQRPYFQKLFEKPFSTFILVVPPVTGFPQFLDGLTAEEAEAERDLLYRLARHLLTTYANSGKTFVLQNWEGDHLLRAALPASANPDSLRIRGMIQWWNLRQEGVRAAREEAKAQNVVVSHACEVNFLEAAMKGKVTVTNDVLPSTQCDLYSYSSWDLSFTPKDLVRALDYLVTRAPESRLYGRRNILLGEFGMGKQHGATGGQRFERIRTMMEAAVGWGVRWAVYWQVYCNEPLRAYNGRPRNRDLWGFWLMRPDGAREPVWNDLAEQYPASLHRAAFTSFTSQYVTVEPGDRSVTAEPWLPGSPWSVFALKDWNGSVLESGDTISLQTHDGLYLSAETGTRGRVWASVSSLGDRERLILRKIGGTGPIKTGDLVTFETSSGRYLAPEVGGRSAVRALRSIPGPAEAFRYVGQEE